MLSNALLFEGIITSACKCSSAFEGLIGFISSIEQFRYAGCRDKSLVALLNMLRRLQRLARKQGQRRLMLCTVPSLVKSLPPATPVPALLTTCHFRDHVGTILISSQCVPASLGVHHNAVIAVRQCRASQILCTSMCSC